MNFVHKNVAERCRGRETIRFFSVLWVTFLTLSSPHTQELRDEQVSDAGHRSALCPGTGIAGS